ncbi:Biopolymer transport protein ExbD/TolR [hydrothermal vent metagenome]|uniref:Biopolymer transport protein ExbD/TolR n=1 Tax=hydrothermal vent metagenome TaxID=652676 RepID=A0A3B1DIE2_9ZZZZ
MRVPSSRHHEEIESDRAMTPMIDVVFLLLIFFVCASAGQAIEETLPTRLNVGSIKSDTPLPDDPPPEVDEVWLTIKQRGANKTVVDMNGTEYTNLATLGETLKQLSEAASDLPVILDIDKEVPMGQVLHIYDLCRAAQFESVNFAATPQEKSKKNVTIQ